MKRRRKIDYINFWKRIKSNEKEFPGQELRTKAFSTVFEQGAYLETQTRISEQICKYVVKLENLSVVRRPKKSPKSMKSCKIYVKLSIVSRNPKENLIYLNISDCFPDVMQSLQSIL